MKYMVLKIFCEIPIVHSLQQIIEKNYKKTKTQN